MDDRTHALWGVPRDGPFTFADLSSRIEPPDLDRVKAAFAATRFRAAKSFAVPIYQKARWWYGSSLLRCRRSC